jgi:uncharacterized protein (UPF0332 family)
VTPEAYLMKARRALASAKVLVADGDEEGAINRAYYAMYDAAHAALCVSGHGKLEPYVIRTHAGLIAAFGRDLVKPGLVAAELGKAFNQVERMRLLADYTGEAISLRFAESAVQQAEVFLRSIEAWIGGRE